MRKILKLCHNELIKISRRASIIVMTLLMVVGIFAIGGFIKLIYSSSMFSYDYSTSDPSGYLEELETEIAELHRQLETIEPADEEYPYSIGNLLDLTADAERCRMILEDNTLSEILQNGYNYMSGVVDSLSMLRAAAEIEKTYPESAVICQQYTGYEDIESMLREYENVYAEHDYNAYISLQKKEIKNNPFLSDNEKAIEIEALELYLKADPNGENMGYELQSAISGVISGKKILLTNMATNYTGTSVPLSTDQREQLKDAVDATVYKLENGYISLDSDTEASAAEAGMSAMISVAFFLILIMMILLAGSSVSQEITSGSIKSLIISPTRRWKIYTAKLTTLFLTGLVLTVAAYLLSTLTTQVLFGKLGYEPYVYMSNGTPHLISPFVYGLLNILLDYLMVFVFMAFAFMLSVVTRNTAAAVSIPLGTYFIGSTVSAFLQMFGITGEWTKFLPFSHLSLSEKVFSTENLLNNMNFGVIQIDSSPSLLFSVIYLAVLLFCMLYTAFDSFTRRDL